MGQIIPIHARHVDVGGEDANTLVLPEIVESVCTIGRVDHIAAEVFQNICESLASGEFTDEQRHVLGLAMTTLRRLGLVARDDPVCDMVAKKIIEIGLVGRPMLARLQE